MVVTIIDYGLSNLMSVRRAIEHLGYRTEITNDKDRIARASVLVLPGVGAFGDGMHKLDLLGISETIREKAQDSIPILGICLGMQLLFDESYEFGNHRGLGLIPGKVVRIPDIDVFDQRQRVPNIGWRKVIDQRTQEEKGECYFLHSYEAKPKDINNQVAEIIYGGRKVCAIVQKDNIVGMQFHPEKSGAVGLALLDSFLEKLNHAY